MEDTEATVELTATISLNGGEKSYVFHGTVAIPPSESREVALSTAINEPEIWWPKQWGEQPLYTGQLLATTTNGTVSDKVEQTFGIRQVTSELNEHNDTVFYVNGYPFQVIGAGYSADMFLRWVRKYNAMNET